MGGRRVGGRRVGGRRQEVGDWRWEAGSCAKIRWDSVGFGGVITTHDALPLTHILAMASRVTWKGTRSVLIAD